MWPPTGIAIASLLLIGHRAWPSIFLGAFVANLTAYGTAWTSAGVATGNTLEGLIGAYLVNRYASGPAAFSRPRDTVAFAALATLAATVSATVGVSSLALGGFARWSASGPVWLTWWLGDATGALSVAPPILLWLARSEPPWSRRQVLERALFLLTLLPAAWFVFGGAFGLVYPIWPFLAWAAFRFGRRDTATVIALLDAIAVWATAGGRGPFVRPNPNESLLLLQTFIGVTALVALPLAGSVAERRAAERRLRDSERRFRALIGYSSIALLAEDGTFLYASPRAERIFGCRPGRLVGRSSLEFVPPADRDGARAALDEVARHPGRSVVLQHRYWHGDGSIRWLESTVSNLLAEPAVRAIIVHLRDTTERRQAEAARQRQQEHDRLLNALAAATGGVTDLQLMLGALLEHLRPVVRLTGGSIILVEGDELVLRAAGGPFAAQALGQRLLRGRGRLWQVIDRGEPFQSADLIAEGFRPTTPVRSYLAVPLLRSGGPFGILEIDSTEPHAFETVDLHLMQRVAAVLGGSVELALRYAAEAQAKADAQAARQAERVAREAAERAADRIARLQAVTAALSGAVTPEQVAEVIIGHAVRGLGAVAAGLSLLTADGASLELIRATGYPEETIRRWRRYAAHQYGGIADALRTGQVVWHDSLDDLHRAYPEHEPLPPAVGRGGRAAVPLLLGDRALGVLYLNFQEPRTFGAGDLEFMLTLGRQCAQALERARLYEHEHHIAESLQQTFLPAGVPQLPGVGVHALYVPGTVEAAIGGDWYDIFDLPDGTVAFSIGDVVGRGLSAAVIMGQVRQTIRVLATEGHDPATVLARAGRTLAATYRSEKMATAVFGALDPVSLSFTYASAGHPAPLLAIPDGRVETLLSSGMPLGIEDASARQCWTVGLPRGSLLVLYTDGLIEATRDVAAGQAALIAAARRVLAEAPADPARALREQVLGGRGLPDDVAVVTVSVAPVPLERLEMSVPADPSSLAPVRRSFRRLARDMGLPDDRAFDVQIALGEALNNAIEHAYGAGAGTIEIRAWRDGRFLVIEVEDHGRWRPERVEGRGHGLLIMRSLADAVDLVRDLSRTVVRLQAVLPGEADTAPEPPAAPHARTIPRHSWGRGEEVAVHTGDQPGSLTPPVVDRQFQIGLADDVPVVRVIGDVDLANAARFEAVLEQAARTDRHAVIVDLSAASYLDSQGAHVLFRFGRRLATNRQRLLLVAPAGPGLRSVLTMTGLAESFPVLGSAEEAVAAATRGG